MSNGNMRRGMILSVTTVALAGGATASTAATVPHHGNHVRVAATCQHGRPGCDVYYHA
jgi:hypothetical protein